MAGHQVLTAAQGMGKVRSGKQQGTGMVVLRGKPGQIAKSKGGTLRAG